MLADLDCAFEPSGKLIVVIRLELFDRSGERHGIDREEMVEAVRSHTPVEFFLFLGHRAGMMSSFILLLFKSLARRVPDISVVAEGGCRSLHGELPRQAMRLLLPRLVKGELLFERKAVDKARSL